MLMLTYYENVCFLLYIPFGYTSPYSSTCRLLLFAKLLPRWSEWNRGTYRSHSIIRTSVSKAFKALEKNSNSKWQFPPECNYYNLIYLECRWRRYCNELINFWMWNRPVVLLPCCYSFPRKWRLHQSVIGTQKYFHATRTTCAHFS